MRLFKATLATGLLLATGASATVVSKNAEKTDSAASGGVEVQIPNGRVQLQCWQNGIKIVDEGKLSVTSVGVGQQANAITFGRPGEAKPSMSIVSQNWTTCVMRKQD